MEIRVAIKLFLFVSDTVGLDIFFRSICSWTKYMGHQFKRILLCYLFRNITEICKMNSHQTIERAQSKEPSPILSWMWNALKPFSFIYIHNSGWKKRCNNKWRGKRVKVNKNALSIYKLFPLSFFSSLRVVCHQCHTIVCFCGFVFITFIEIIAMSSDNTLQWYNVSVWARTKVKRYFYVWRKITKKTTPPKRKKTAVNRNSFIKLKITTSNMNLLTLCELVLWHATIP